jgi:hypothetical protein
MNHYYVKIDYFCVSILNRDFAMAVKLPLPFNYRVIVDNNRCHVRAFIGGSSVLVATVTKQTIDVDTGMGMSRFYRYNFKNKAPPSLRRSIDNLKDSIVAVGKVNS